MVLIALIEGALHEKPLSTSDRCSAFKRGCERTVMLEGLPPSTPMGYLYDIYIYTYIYGFNHLEKYENQWEG